MSITLTSSATKRIASQIAQNQAFGLRLGVKKSGCSGYSYVMDFADSANDDDLVFEQDGVNVVVDKQSLELLSGMELDYVSEGLNQTFKFRNPNATDECGCGESFASKQ